MKKILCLFIICVCAISLVAEDKSSREIRKSSEYRNARLNGAETQVLLHVRDDQDAPVADADVLVRMGMTFAEKSYDIKGVTDANGDFAIEGITTGNEIGISLVKTGYYDSHCQLCYADMRAPHDVKDGKWQPYPMERTVTLRKIMNPAALKIGGGRYDIPGTNQWYSFDAVRGDWVEPYGRGVLPDFDIFYEWTGWNPLECERQAFRVRFLNSKYNGYCFPDKTVESVFPYAYVADASTSYANDFYDECVGTNARDGVFDNKKDMLFRIRSETNKVGKVVSCYYGRFLKLNCYLRRDGTGGLLLRYQYNPVPNDTNLEDAEVSRRNERSCKSLQRRGDEPK